MHQIPASVNAFCAWFVALHFWPIFDPSSLKTAEIRHFPSASAAKTVELESNRRSVLGLSAVPDTSDTPWVAISTGLLPDPKRAIIKAEAARGRLVRAADQGSRFRSA